MDKKKFGDYFDEDFEPVEDLTDEEMEEEA